MGLPLGALLCSHRRIDRCQLKTKHAWVTYRVYPHSDGALGQKFALQDQRGQRIFDPLLDGAFERPRAKHRVKAHFGQFGQRRGET